MVAPPMSYAGDYHVSGDETHTSMEEIAQQHE